MGHAHRVAGRRRGQRDNSSDVSSHDAGGGSVVSGETSDHLSDRVSDHATDRVSESKDEDSAGGHEAGGHEAGGHEAGGHEAGGHEAGGHEAGGHEAGGHEAEFELGWGNGESGHDGDGSLSSSWSSHAHRASDGAGGCAGSAGRWGAAIAELSNSSAGSAGSAGSSGACGACGASVAMDDDAFVESLFVPTPEQGGAHESVAPSAETMRGGSSAALAAASSAQTIHQVRSAHASVVMALETTLSSAHTDALPTAWRARLSVQLASACAQSQRPNTPPLLQTSLAPPRLSRRFHRVCQLLICVRVDANCVARRLALREVEVMQRMGSAASEVQIVRALGRQTTSATSSFAGSPEPSFSCSSPEMQKRSRSEKWPGRPSLMSEERLSRVGGGERTARAPARRAVVALRTVALPHCCPSARNPSTRRLHAHSPPTCRVARPLNVQGGCAHSSRRF